MCLFSHDVPHRSNLFSELLQEAQAGMAEKVKWNYDPLDLIELIGQRPCIWDKTCEDYKDRVKKLNAWSEVCNFLIDNYENLEERDKLIVGKIVN